MLVYDGQFLAHFAALDLIQGLQEGVTILWVHVAMTDPDYQGSGALLLAAKALLNPEGLALLGDELYLVFRTANPKLYEAMRTLRSTFTPDGFYGDAWYPQIAPGGTMVPVPANITELAACLAARLSPNHEFVRDTFVIKGCFQDFDPLWQDLDEFPCRNAMTKDYFTKNLDNSNQDGLMIIVQIVRPTDCREPQKIATDAESA
ncbi:hypothetical protein A9X04_13365 [Mycobacterium sp. E3247]|nr:hypothetical protein A9X04_13365 [Mycobacterium sp. E3247]